MNYATVKRKQKISTSPNVPSIQLCNRTKAILSIKLSITHILQEGNMNKNKKDYASCRLECHIAHQDGKEMHFRCLLFRSM